MINLLDFLIELANIPHARPEINAIIKKQPIEIQYALLNHDAALLKKQFSDSQHFINERTVVQL